MLLTAPIEQEQQTRFSFWWTHPWLEVDQKCARNVVFIICLVKEYVFTVTPLCRPVLEDALFVDTVLGTKPLPEDGAHYNAWSDPMSNFELNHSCAYFGCHIGRSVPSQFREAWHVLCWPT